MITTRGARPNGVVLAAGLRLSCAPTATRAHRHCETHCTLTRVYETLCFRIGQSNRAHVIVDSLRRENPEATDYWDGNWLVCTVAIAAGGFRGRFDAQLRADEFARFHEQLRPLYDKLVGHAVFDPMEPWLRIEVEGDGKGHFRAACRATDQVGVGNTLAFKIEFDQMELPEILKGLDAVCHAFPVVGAP